MTVEVAGRRFDAEPQTVTRGFLGELDGQSVSVNKVGDGSVTINNRKIATEIQKISINEDSTRHLSTVHYSRAVYPFFLRKDTKVTTGDAEKLVSQAQLEVIAVDMPWKVLASMHDTAHIRTVHRRGRTTRVTLDIHCLDIPGGRVSQTWKETDETGKLIRRSTLELIDYGQGEEKTGIVGRRVFRKKPPRKRQR